jgi:TatD DNase family protein
VDFIDTHAHMTSGELAPQLADVIARAEAAGIRQIISVASDAEDAQAAHELATAHRGIFSSAGVHPHEAGKVAAGDLDRITALWGRPKVVAVGEIGLDYYYDFADRESQRRVFAEQLERALHVDLPLIIHCRDAFIDCVAMLEQHGFRNRRVVFHCFTGTTAEAACVAEHGWRISFTGVVTFRKSVELQQIAKAYPADQLMVETDSPYLSPEPVRKMRPNEPANVAHTATFLAQLRGVPLALLASQTHANSTSFFGLS